MGHAWSVESEEKSGGRACAHSSMHIGVHLRASTEPRLSSEMHPFFSHSANTNMLQGM